MASGRLTTHRVDKMRLVRYVRACTVLPEPSTCHCRPEDQLEDILGKVILECFIYSMINYYGLSNVKIIISDLSKGSVKVKMI